MWLLTTALLAALGGPALAADIESQLIVTPARITAIGPGGAFLVGIENRSAAHVGTAILDCTGFGADGPVSVQTVALMNVASGRTEWTEWNWRGPAVRYIACRVAGATAR